MSGVSATQTVQHFPAGPTFDTVEKEVSRIKGPRVPELIRAKIERVFSVIAKAGPSPHLKLFFYHTFLTRSGTGSYRAELCEILNESYVALDQAVREIKVNESTHKAIAEQGKFIGVISARVNALSKVLHASSKDKALLLSDLKNHFAEIHSSKAKQVQWALVQRRLYDQADSREARSLLDDILHTNVGALDTLIGGHQRQTAAEIAIAAHEGQIDEAVMFAFEALDSLEEKPH